MDSFSNSTQKGLTLVEVLIATAILAVGLLAVSSMIAKSTIQDSRAYYLTKASMMVEEFFEKESHKQYSDVSFGQIETLSSPITETVDGVNYTMNCIVQNATPFDYCKEMTCTVTWNNKGLPARTSYVYDFCRN
ncbi:prepilin-type N-terminal cleavage/methylation domain-containing protein [Desulfomicrobium apsheronum]|uniref:Prepilin-type N-terminal cleavage/methylation domain-containing protein n=1 Tax=Desulfomicrobium apsheronum TaxID=52560 RepID=A0A1I3NVJ0_9BACT|nr:prepilin-type N-terminal cleavage/methylation domain-containing protein [Desulfomicrobium apsheronum]SFJ13030.1 prepilin-type N-terminal cleavage/methylation domain-containing protein [Desulfomicrobium apsheronum]